MISFDRCNQQFVTLDISGLLFQSNHALTPSLVIQFLWRKKGSLFQFSGIVSCLIHCRPRQLTSATAKDGEDLARMTFRRKLSTFFVARTLLSAIQRDKQASRWQNPSTYENYVGTIGPLANIYDHNTTC
jgi:hypothetical protein